MNVGVVFGDIDREIVISGHDHVYFAIFAEYLVFTTISLARVHHPTG
jgi:hypothetical protein